MRGIHNSDTPDKRCCPEEHERRVQQNIRAAEVRFAVRWNNPITWLRSKSRQQGECLAWKGFINPKTGYASLQFNRVHYLAHRFTWLIHRGPIPDGLMVLHTCDNRPCCNPDHLFLGTHQDNMDDAKAKNRFKPPLGEAHGQSKLKTKQVLNIIRLVTVEGLSQSAVARRYGVHQCNVSRIVGKKRWAHIPTPTPKGPGPT